MQAFLCKGWSWQVGGVSWGAHDPPNVSLFFKQTTHNIQVRKLVSALGLTQGALRGPPYFEKSWLPPCLPAGKHKEALSN